MKTAELTGALLDYWVAKSEGWIETRSNYDDKPRLWDTGGGFYRIDGHAGTAGDERWRPSTYWAHAGPIIERERIGIIPFGSDGYWMGSMPGDADYCMGVDGADGLLGLTPLIAGMRAYVASKFGDDVPEDVAQ